MNLGLAFRPTKISLRVVAALLRFSENFRMPLFLITLKHEAEEFEPEIKASEIRESIAAS